VLGRCFKQWGRERPDFDYGAETDDKFTPVSIYFISVSPGELQATFGYSRNLEEWFWPISTLGVFSLGDIIWGFMSRWPFFICHVSFYCVPVVSVFYCFWEPLIFSIAFYRIFSYCIDSIALYCTLYFLAVIFY